MPSKKKPRAPASRPSHQACVAAPPRQEEDADGRAAAKFEATHVHGVYDAIAGHFSATRHTAWPQVSEFLRRARARYATVLDVGCGNGKYFHAAAGVAAAPTSADEPVRTRRRRRRKGAVGGTGPGSEAEGHAAEEEEEGGKKGDGDGAAADNGADLPDAEEDTIRFVLGTDTCEALVRGAVQGCGVDTADGAVADSLALPVRAGAFDVVVCIAVLHHLCTRARRVAALREMARATAPGGELLVYVWARERPTERQQQLVLQEARAHHGAEGEVKAEAEAGAGVQEKRGEVEETSAMMRRRFDAGDMLVPWHVRQKREGAASEKVLDDWHEVRMRFYHVYEQGELEAEVRDAGGLAVERVWYDHQNWCIVARRVADGDG